MLSASSAQATDGYYAEEPSSQASSPKAVLYADPDFTGTAWEVYEHEYFGDEVAASPVGNDTISSFELEAGCVIEACLGTNFDEECYTFDTSVDYLEDPFHDAISSFEIICSNEVIDEDEEPTHPQEETWEQCSNYGGICFGKGLVLRYVDGYGEVRGKTVTTQHWVSGWCLPQFFGLGWFNDPHGRCEAMVVAEEPPPPSTEVWNTCAHNSGICYGEGRVLRYVDGHGVVRGKTIKTAHHVSGWCLPQFFGLGWIHDPYGRCESLDSPHYK